MKPPIFLQVAFGSLRPWSKNPREATTRDAEILAKRIKSKGLFRNFVCWQEPADVKAKTYTVGGGNVRLKTMRDILKVKPETPVWISLNYPETEAQKIELSLLDNMPSGSYIEQALAELVYPFREEIDLSEYTVQLNPGADLARFLEGFGPGEVPDVEDLDGSDRKMISVKCTDDEDLLDMRDRLGIDGKTNEIDSAELRALLKK